MISECKADLTDAVVVSSRNKRAAQDGFEAHKTEIKFKSIHSEWKTQNRAAQRLNVNDKENYIGTDNATHSYDISTDNATHSYDISTDNTTHSYDISNENMGNRSNYYGSQNRNSKVCIDYIGTLRHDGEIWMHSSTKFNVTTCAECICQVCMYNTKGY